MRTRTWVVAISCDGCRRERAGDVEAVDQAGAEDGLRVRLVAERGWSCDAAGDFCERCRPVAAEPVTEDGPAVEVAGPTMPAPVEALHLIDRLIGNADTLDAETVGRVRGIVLDTLGAWHQRQRVLDAEHAAWRAGDDPVAAGKVADPGGLWT